MSANYHFSTLTQTNSDNPKAVFIGDNQALINVLGMYISDFGVELFAGKNLEDAVFGNYFFYIGSDEGVKNFLEANVRELPKTLLLLTEFSNKEGLKPILEKYPQIKTVFLEAQKIFNRKEIEEIFKFFLGSSTQILDLVPDIKSTSFPENKNEDLSFVSIKNIDSSFLGKEIKKDPSQSEITSLSKSKEIAKFEKSSSPKDALKHKATPGVADFFAPKKTGLYINKKNYLKRIALFGLFLLGLLLILFLPVISIVTTSSFGGYFLNKAYRQIEKKDYVEAGFYLDSAHFFLQISQKQIDFVSKLVGKNSSQFNSQIIITIADNITLSLDYLSSAAVSANQLLGGVFRQNPGVFFATTSSNLFGDLNLANQQLSQAEALLTSLSKKGQSSIWLLGDVEKLKTQLSKQRSFLTTANHFGNILSDLIGLNGKRTYLVVFQNNMEIRATGGFIGSYGLLTFEDGVLKQMTIDDVYTADGSLKGHVDPPEPISKYLGQEHWYMRDSNWNPDFRQSAEKLIWFINKELDISVDGVFAVDLTFAKNILEVTGPVKLFDYSDSITAENLFLKVQTEVQQDFFPGSTKKKDLLSSLTQTLLTTIVSEKDGFSPQLLQKINLSLRSKDLLIYLTRPVLQKTISSLGWSGEMKPFDHELSRTTQGKCEADCFFDYGYMVDSNLGVNKVNYFIKRTLKDNVKISDEGKLTHQVMITYQNLSLETHNFGGNYKNYFRFYAPFGSTLGQASFGSKQFEKSENILGSEEKIGIGEENGFTVFGGLINIGQGETKTLILTYALPASFDPDKYKYVYKFQKQPGTDANENFNLQIQYPVSWQLFSADTLVNDNIFTYNNNLSQDVELKLTFSD